MPWYNDLRPNKGDDKKQDYALLFPEMSSQEKVRCIDRLLDLRKGLSKEIPFKRSDNNLLISSWNIKEFGHTTQRNPEAYFYIAEILNRFDLIAIQEVKSSLKDLNIIVRLLGKDWAYQVNDITEGSSGNSERSAYLFNKKRVELSGVSGEITLWDDLTKDSDLKQLKRTPYITGFKAGWKKLSLINLHLHPGEGDNNIDLRMKEVKLLLDAIAYKQERNRFWTENMIVLGDFNFYDKTANKVKDEPAIQLFRDKGFRQIDALIGKDTNASNTEAFDRLFLHVNEFFKIQKDDEGKEIGGVFNPYNYVFRDEDLLEYKEEMLEDYGGTKDMNNPDNLNKYYKHPWRKNQLSDHYPIWAEVVIDSSEDFLKQKKELLVEEMESVSEEDPIEEVIV